MGMADAVAQRQQKRNKVPVTRLCQHSQYLSKKGGHHVVLQDIIRRCCRRVGGSLKLPEEQPCDQWFYSNTTGAGRGKRVKEAYWMMLGPKEADICSGLENKN